MLENKVAFITGAGSGFGLATAQKFVEQGAAVALVDYNEAAVNAAAQAITDKGGKALALVVDVSQEDQIKKAIEDTVAHFGKLDILFNNAGIFVEGNVETTSLEGWEKGFAVNITALFLACKYAMPHLRETKGNIINTASAGGIIGFPNAVAYAASKGAVISFTRTVAVDYANQGIRSNCVAPGTGETGMTNDLLENEDIRQGFTAPIPMQRLGQPEDVANAALYLASDLASYVTGQVISVDGGWTMS